METEQPLAILSHAYRNYHISSIINSCGQLGSSNPSVSNNLPLSYTFSIDPSFLTYDASLSFLVICVVLHRTLLDLEHAAHLVWSNVAAVCSPVGHHTFFTILLLSFCHSGDV